MDRTGHNYGMDGLTVALGNRGMTVKAARQCAKVRKEWRTLVHIVIVSLPQSSAAQLPSFDPSCGGVLP